MKHLVALAFAFVASIFSNTPDIKHIDPEYFTPDSYYMFEDETSISEKQIQQEQKEENDHYLTTAPKVAKALKVQGSNHYWVYPQKKQPTSETLEKNEYTFGKAQIACVCPDDATITVASQTNMQLESNGYTFVFENLKYPFMVENMSGHSYDGTPDMISKPIKGGCLVGRSTESTKFYILDSSGNKITLKSYYG